MEMSYSRSYTSDSIGAGTYNKPVGWADENGTYVNGALKADHALGNGDRISAGTAEISFRQGSTTELSHLLGDASSPTPGTGLPAGAGGPAGVTVGAA